ncbi:hypothetical protein D0Z00_003451 [Geotrichum galactomycetum]|uniref:Uncharacterized protein n=1 Tax=Geotrichum galactomycetum TaxID=27317 RepID=A0ACB6V169_9ASCO|nr:hypothetical protein D0Z00_003451 [Geotrichum candidum]
MEKQVNNAPHAVGSLKPENSSSSEDKSNAVGNENEIRAYAQDSPNPQEIAAETTSLHPHQSHVSIFIQKQVGLFHESLRGLHWKIFIKSIFTLLYMAALILGILSIFWGSMFNRSDRVSHLNIWVMNYDNGAIGQSLVNITEGLAAASPKNLGYQTVTPEQYAKPISDIETDINNEVAWGALVIQPNASTRLQNAIANNISYIPNDVVTFYFSEGRQNNIIDELILPAISRLNDSWSTTFKSDLLANLTSTLNQTQIGAIVATNPNIITNPVSIALVNTSPVVGDVSAAILSIGLIFLIIVSFFQIANFAQIQLIMLGKIPFIQYMLYRPFINMITIFMLSLAFSLVSLAFQQDFTQTFGHRGFMIYWMINFMAMWALGGASENIAGVIIAIHPPAIGFWLIFWVVMNSSTGIYPLELSPGIYHVGRALPIYNAQMAIRTVLYGTRNRLGLNFGVFTAWIVINWLVSFPSMAAIKYIKGRQAKKAAAKAAAAANTKA